MAREKQWLALPFLGASSGRSRSRRPSQAGSSQGSRASSRRRAQHQQQQHQHDSGEQNPAQLDGHDATDHAPGAVKKEKQSQQQNGSSTPPNANLQQTGSAVERFAAKTEEDVVKDINSPIHMWVVATLFPLMAGTFGPMASMFNICAIVVPWRMIVNPASTQSNGRRIEDPTWLVAVNIVSLVVALIANLSLLGQMTNRIRYSISAPITVCGWYVSGIVDIALVSAAYTHLPLPDDPNATYSQAFYYAAFSGAIYFILGILLSVTAYCIFIGQYSNEYKLSLAQRSLMLQTILFLAYVLAAGGVYSLIEGWSFLDSTYFVVVTLFTIGFGDFAPDTHLGRSLFFPFSVGGILFVGVIIANIRTLVLESGSVKVSTRMVEKARWKAVNHGNPSEGIVKLRGVTRRDTHGETEIERREKEFNIMREIQQLAAFNNRMFSLAFSLIAFMILWFIGAVIFWQASKATGGQNWTYFGSLYFTFVAQLTIGYGDYSPNTNSGKPAFVFWALIALPTLTVLIGAIGDAVGSFVNWYTLWLTNHAQDLWRWFQIFQRKSSQPLRALDEARNEANADLSQEYRDETGFHEIANVHRARTVPADLDVSADRFTEFQLSIAEETYKPFIMLKAAQTILGHLDEEEPRKYTYKEWTWLLKMLGEDETDDSGHRKAGLPPPEGTEVLRPVSLDSDGRPTSSGKGVWSWIGSESPLMSLDEG